MDKKVESNKDKNELPDSYVSSRLDTEVKTEDQASPSSTSSSRQLSNKQKKLTVVIAIVVLLLIIGASYRVGQNNSIANVTKNIVLPAAQVSITSTGFSPATITIKPGQAVVWTNTDTMSHEVASDPYPVDNELSTFNDRQPLLQNDTYSYIFDLTGTYTYHDTLNPYSLKGTVIVK